MCCILLNGHLFKFVPLIINDVNFLWACGLVQSSASFFLLIWLKAQVLDRHKMLTIVGVLLVKE
jgi:hypothetical protein